MGYGKHAIGVIQAQVFLAGEWQMPDIGQRLEITRREAAVLELVAITGNPVG
jgi:hypothetical protein